MARPLSNLKNVWDLSPKVVKIDIFDGQDKRLSNSTGFLMAERDGLYLYTCWHAVTGLNFIEPKFRQPPNRRKLRVEIQTVKRTPPITAVGGRETVEIPLYNNRNEPAWEQETSARSNSDLEAIGISVPETFDLVRMRINLDAEQSPELIVQSEDIYYGLCKASDDVLIAGYPHRYSAMGDESPEPVFLKRSVATNRHKGFSFLIDGACAPGMSGGPVFTYEHNRWWLAGIYTGVIYPDYKLLEESEDERAVNDRFSALGSVLSFAIAKDCCFEMEV